MFPFNRIGHRLAFEKIKDKEHSIEREALSLKPGINKIVYLVLCLLME